MNLLIMGAPGSGKGTFSSRLKEEYGLKHISTGDIFRANIKNKTELGMKAKSYMDEGHLVPDEIVNGMVVETLKSLPSDGAGYLLDGYPRTLAQARAFDALTGGSDQAMDVVLYMDVPQDVLTKRITGRRTCPGCGEIYNIYYKPAKVEGECDHCHSPLTQRADDNEESLKTRLDDYNALTKPVIDYYSDQDKVRVIHAEKTFDEIWEEITEALKA